MGQILRFLLWICVLLSKSTYFVEHFNYKSGEKDHKSEVCFGKENFEGERSIADYRVFRMSTGHMHKEKEETYGNRLGCDQRWPERQCSLTSQQLWLAEA